MANALEPLRFVSSSILAVRLGSYDGEAAVAVVVERSAIDDYFGFHTSTGQQRWDVVKANLNAIFEIISERHARREWSSEIRGTSGYVRQFVLKHEDLKRMTLHFPKALSLTISRERSRFSSSVSPSRAAPSLSRHQGDQPPQPGQWKVSTRVSKSGVGDADPTLVDRAG